MVANSIFLNVIVWRFWTHKEPQGSQAFSQTHHWVWFFFVWLKDNAENLSTSFLSHLNQFWHWTRNIYRLVWHVDFPPAPSRFYFIWCFDDFRSEVLEFKEDWQRFKSWGSCWEHPFPNETRNGRETLPGRNITLSSNQQLKNSWSYDFSLSVCIRTCLHIFLFFSCHLERHLESWETSFAKTGW